MDKYTIQKAYHWTNDDDIEITSENLLYTELGKTHIGCQCNSMKNQRKITKICIQIAKLIRQIEELNKGVE
jgi:hypothetical protein